ncbi:MAG: EMC3/TMCO1 family protein [Candidatus Hermodarchaeota archaeon]
MFQSGPNGLFDLFPWLVRTFFPHDPPFSSIGIILVSITLSLTMTLISRLLIDTTQLETLTQKSTYYRKLMMKVNRGTASAKERLLWERKGQKEMTKINSELMNLRMRPMLFYFIPMILVFGAMNGYFNYPLDPLGAIPAIFPIPLPQFMGTTFIAKYGWNMPMTGIEQVFFIPSFIWFYFLSSISIGGIIQKLGGLQPEM